MSEPKFVFHYGGHEPSRFARRGAPIQVFTEDCFSGKLVSPQGKPRELAPFPYVNPLTGPIAIEGAKAGQVVAVHLKRLEPARDWGVSTVSPNFGALSGTRNNPNLQPEQEERVWIWRVDREAGTVSSNAGDEPAIVAPLRPFHGSLGVAPPHGEVRSSVATDVFGGNMDICEVAAGATVYLRTSVDGGMVYIGDGHYAQGDGEIAGTAVEGALLTELVFEAFDANDDIPWPRIETDQEIGVVGAARPLEDAARIASHALIRWIASLTGLSLAHAHQQVSQNVRLRIGNLVNPLYTVAAFVPKEPLAAPIFENAHRRLRSI